MAASLGALGGHTTQPSGRNRWRGYTLAVMPTYEYVCRSCGHLFEIVQSMKDEALTECPVCGGELRKVFAPPAISFKGSGFYATDHGRNSQKSSEHSSDKPEKSDRPERTEKRDSKDAKQDTAASTPSEKKASDSGSPSSGSSSGSSKSGSGGPSPKEGASS
jgi:putative FmdB family regulatory protein